MRVGGHSARSTQFTPVAMKVLREVKPQLEARLRRSLTTYKAISYTRQIVAGEIYNFTIDIGGEVIEISAFNPLGSGAAQLR